MNPFARVGIAASSYIFKGIYVLQIEIFLFVLKQTPIPAFADQQLDLPYTPKNKFIPFLSPCLS
jgi:hypothetical protein